MIGPGSNQISIVWETSDVQEVCPFLSDDEAMDVLIHVEAHHDANYGISWDTLRYATEAIYPEIWEKWDSMPWEEQDAYWEKQHAKG